MDSLINQFLVGMLASGRTDYDQMIADATSLAVRRTTREANEALEPRDRQVLDALITLSSRGTFKTRGLLSSEWKSYCLQTNICARRAWETSSQRLLRAGLARQVNGRRWFPVVDNAPAALPAPVLPPPVLP
jgi:hypothetical protein